MDDFEFARDLTASIYTAFMLAMRNAKLTADQISKIMTDATVLTEAILKNPEVPVFVNSKKSPAVLRGRS